MENVDKIYITEFKFRGKIFAGLRIVANSEKTAKKLLQRYGLKNYKIVGKLING